MQWITVATPPFGWIEQFDKVRAQLGERPAGLQARYVGSGSGSSRSGSRRSTPTGTSARGWARRSPRRSARNSSRSTSLAAASGSRSPGLPRGTPPGKPSPTRPSVERSARTMGRVVGAKRVAAGFVAAGGAKAAADAFEANLAQPRWRPAERRMSIDARSERSAMPQADPAQLRPRRASSGSVTSSSGSRMRGTRTNPIASSC
jgi:hypothetical protein